MKKYFLFSLILSLAWFNSVAAFSTSDFQYYRSINSDKNYSGSAWVGLDEAVYNHSDYGDIRIVNNTSGTDVPYVLFNNDQQEYAPLAKVIARSSQRQDYRGDNFAAANIFDGDINTAYEPDWQRDAGESWLVIDLQEEVLVSELQIITLNPEYRWSTLRVESSTDAVSFSGVKEYARYQSGTLQLPEVITRYIKLTFTYDDSLQLSELQLAGTGNSKILFFHQAGTIYTMYYGSLTAATPEYDTNGISISKNLPVLTLGQEITNPRYDDDTDNDGIVNTRDNCPLVSNAAQTDSDNDTIGDACDNAPFASNKIQADTDNDGVGDEDDNCPFLKNPDQLDKDLDGIGWVCDDEDTDSVINSQDNCPTIKNYRQEDINNNGIGDACEEDWDGDGVPQLIDNCRNAYNPGQEDQDNDGIGDQCDNCLTLSNRDQLDTDEDGVGNACIDTDGDSVFDVIDNCPDIANSDQTDVDGDGVGDACDNCRNLKNTDQLDENNDGIGDLCGDNDQDGVMGYQDNCPDIANTDQADADNDGIGDMCEDTDNDGIINGLDNCKNKANALQADADKDGVGDVCDETDNRFSEQYAWLMWLLIGLAVAVIAFFAIRLLKKADADILKE